MKIAFGLVLSVSALWLAACGTSDDNEPTGSPLTPTPSQRSSTPMTSASPTPTTTDLLDQWEWYQDRETDFILRFPAGDFEEQPIQFPAQGETPDVVGRAIRFTTDSGVLSVYVTIAENPSGLALEEWVTTYVGVPPESSEIDIAAERGIVLPVDPFGESAPAIYFSHEQQVFSVSANFHGLDAWGAPAPMTEDQYDEMLRQFDFVVPALESPLTSFHDPDYGFTLRYPAVWRRSDVVLDETQLGFDVLKGIELVGQGELLRASIYVSGNPDGLSLEDWGLDHNAIFFDTEPEEEVIDRQPALVQPLSLGIPSPLAYVAVGDIVISIKGLTPDDYQVLAENIELP